MKPFLPDYTAHSGDMLDMFMEDLNLSVTQVAEFMGVDIDVVEKFIRNGHSIDNKITPEMLEKVTGVTIKFWHNVDTQYKKDKIRLGIE